MKIRVGRAELSFRGDVVHRTETFKAKGFLRKMRIIADVFWHQPMAEALQSQFQDTDDLGEEVRRVAGLTHSALVSYALNGEFDWGGLSYDRVTLSSLTNDLGEMWASWWPKAMAPNMTRALDALASAIYALNGKRIRRARVRLFGLGGYVRDPKRGWVEHIDGNVHNNELANMKVVMK